MPEPAQSADYTPGTFAERGVSLPFTTPQLNGARLRPARDGLDLVIPNPSGARGRYVLPIGAVPAYCTMSLHDRSLHERILQTRVVTPDTIRVAAHAVASLGLAGRGVAAAARDAQQAEQRQALLINFNMMMALVRCVEPAASHATRLEIAAAEEVEQRARQAVAILAPRLNCATKELHDMLDLLGRDLVPIGWGPSADQARLPQVLQRLIALRHGVERWAQPATRPGAEIARLVLDVADATIALARETIEAARGGSADVIAMLRLRIAEPGQLAALLARPAWLLDGWDDLCLIWDTPIPVEHRLCQIASLLPLVPREAAGWGRLLYDPDVLDQRSANVEMNVDWRTATPVYDLTAANEQRRILAA